MRLWKGRKFVQHSTSMTSEAGIVRIQRTRRSFRKKRMSNRMRRGYLAMATINLIIAEECLVLEKEAEEAWKEEED